ncbi:hypothetical protein GMSM_25770 [Geomonas sp. Red276]
MGAIIDTLLLGEAELDVIKNEYPTCIITKQTNSHHIIQQYRIILSDEDEEDYYYFLLEHSIAMSSMNFIGRIRNDKLFRDKMRLKVSHTIERLINSKKPL